MELRKKLSDPTQLGHAAGNCTVLGLGTGSGHCVLSLGRPKDQVRTEEHTEAGGRAESIGTTRPISITVGK